MQAKRASLILTNSTPVYARAMCASMGHETSNLRKRKFTCHSRQFYYVDNLSFGGLKRRGHGERGITEKIQQLSRDMSIVQDVGLLREIAAGRFFGIGGSTAGKPGRHRRVISALIKHHFRSFTFDGDVTLRAAATSLTSSIKSKMPTAAGYGTNRSRHSR